MKKWQFSLLHAIVCLLMLVLVSMPVNVAERNNAGNDLYAQGSYESAILAYQAAEVQAPDAPEAYYNAANALVETGQLRSAQASLQQALLNADESLIKKAYFNLGNIYYQLAFYDDAVAAYREVLVRDPADQDARHNYEMALARSEPTPTPTLQEQQTNPEEDNTNPDAVPTNKPAAQDQSELTPSPTPTPLPTHPVGPLDEPPPTLVPNIGGTPGQFESTPVPQENGPQTVEDAERQLDGIEADQRTLREYLSGLVTPGPLNEKDW